MGWHGHGTQAGLVHSDLAAPGPNPGISETFPIDVTRVQQQCAVYCGSGQIKIDKIQSHIAASFMGGCAVQVVGCSLASLLQ